MFWLPLSKHPPPFGTGEKMVPPSRRSQKKNSADYSKIKNCEHCPTGSPFAYVRVLFFIGRWYVLASALEAPPLWHSGKNGTPISPLTL